MAEAAVLAKFGGGQVAPMLATAGSEQWANSKQHYPFLAGAYQCHSNAAGLQSDSGRGS